MQKREKQRQRIRNNAKAHGVLRKGRSKYATYDGKKQHFSHLSDEEKVKTN